MARRQPAAPPPEAVDNVRQLLTTAEVATQLRVDSVTVRRMIRSGELRGYRVGREYRVNPAHLAEFLGSQLVVEATEAATTAATLV